MSSIITSLDFFFGKKLPSLPAGLKEFIVKFTPWGMIVVPISIISTIMGLLGVFSFSAYYGYGGAPNAIGLSITSLVWLVGMIISLFAWPGLFKRTIKGWTILFYSCVVLFAAGVLNGGIVSELVGFLFVLYILFQTRSYYTGVQSSTSQPMLQNDSETASISGQGGGAPSI